MHFHYISLVLLVISGVNLMQAVKITNEKFRHSSNDEDQNIKTSKY